MTELTTLNDLGSNAGLGADFTLTAPADIVIAYRRDKSGAMTWVVITKKQAAVDIIQGQPYYAPNAPAKGPASAGPA